MVAPFELSGVFIVLLFSMTEQICKNVFQGKKV
jgi:hypothetical protein